MSDQNTNPSAPVSGTGQPDIINAMPDADKAAAAAELLARLAAATGKDTPKARKAAPAPSANEACQAVWDAPPTRGGGITNVAGEAVGVAPGSGEASVVSPAAAEPVQRAADPLAGIPVAPSLYPLIQFSVAGDYRSQSEMRSPSLDKMADVINAAKPLDDKKRGAILHFGVFPDGVFKRTLANIEAATAMAFDFDYRNGDRTRRDDVLDACRLAGIAVIVWDSFSSGLDPADDGMTFRAVFPYAVTQAIDTHHGRFALIANAIGFTAPGKALPVSQGFFFQPRTGNTTNALALPGLCVDEAIEGFKDLPVDPGFGTAKGMAQGDKETIRDGAKDGYYDTLTDEQIADVRAVIAAAHVSGIYLSRGRGLSHQIVGSLVGYGEIGLQLLAEWFAGNAKWDDTAEFWKTVSAKTHSPSAPRFTIARFFDIACREMGLANPATGRKVDPVSAFADFGGDEAGAAEPVAEETLEEQLQKAKVVIEAVILAVANDTGAAFTKEAIAAFRLIQENDLPEYQRITLKLAPYRLKSAIEKAIRDTKRVEREAKQEANAGMTHHYFAKALVSLAAKSSGGVTPVATRGHLFIYKAGLWSPVTVNALGTKVAAHFDGNDKCEEARDYRAIAVHAMNLTEDESFFDGAPIGIACDDTFYRCTPEAVIAEPLAPHHRQVERIPFAPVEMATPRFDQFLQETFIGPDGRGEDRILLMQEVFGAVLLRLTHNYHKAVLFYDPFGRAGKGVISTIIGQLIPASVTEAIPLHDWDNEYRLALMAPCWLNLVGEIDPDKPMASGVFKNVTGGDLVTGRIIYTPPFKFKPLCTHIFSGNAFPPTRDHTDAFFARWLVIHFPNSRTRLGLQLNPNLAREIIATEMPGIVVWALAGAQRLLTTGHFTMTAEHHALIGEWRKATNSLELFIAECCEVDPKTRVSKPEFYRAYNKWCLNNGHKPTSKHEAGRRLLGIGGLRIWESDSKGVSYFNGLHVNHQAVADFG